MLDDTLVIWGGEFGRTPFREGRTAASQILGRDHYPDCFTVFLAGGGVKFIQIVQQIVGFHADPLAPRLRVVELAQRQKLRRYLGNIRIVHPVVVEVFVLVFHNFG
jgi:hypothetical protein